MDSQGEVDADARIEALQTDGRELHTLKSQVR